jgi:hypothetical protein
MSKRKVVVIAGYEESSDDFKPDLENCPKRPSKKLPPVAYTPPRLTTASKAGLGVFQLPGASVLPSRNRSLPLASSRHPTPAIESTHSARNVPDIQAGEYQFITFNTIPYLVYLPFQQVQIWHKDKDVVREECGIPAPARGNAEFRRNSGTVRDAAESRKPLASPAVPIRAGCAQHSVNAAGGAQRQN